MVALWIPATVIVIVALDELFDRLGYAWLARNLKKNLESGREITYE